MADDLEAERSRLVKEMSDYARAARKCGLLCAGLFIIAGSLGWISDEAMLPKLPWLLLCLGSLLGFQWVIFEMEVIRAKVQLSLLHTKCQVLDRSLK
jgi:hypothetical protein